MVVREYVREADADGIRACLVELQDFEQRIDPRMPAGDVIANNYISDALSKCAECHGRIFVADEDGEIAGFAIQGRGQCCYLREFLSFAVNSE